MIRPSHAFPLFAATLLSGCMGSGGSAPWSERFGDSAEQNTVTIGVDDSGAVALTGSFAGSMTFGSGTLVGTNQNDEDVFLARLDRSGDPVWSGATGNDGPQVGRGIVIDPQGDMIGCGVFSGRVNFGKGKLTALSSEIFAARFDADGKATWVGHYSADLGGPSGAGSSDPTGGIAVDRDGNIALAGYFTGTLGFGGPALDALEQSQNTFVAKLDPKGKHVFSKAFGGGGHQANGIAFDADGNVVVVGTNLGVVELGSASFASGGENGFAAKLGPEGEPKWLVQFGGAGTSEAQAVATDAAGNVFVAGTFTGNFVVGGRSLDVFSNSSGFVVKLSPSGEPAWVKNFDGARVAAVTTTASGDVFFTGAYEGDPDFGSGPLPFRNLDGVFLAGLTTEGKHRYSKAFVTKGSTSSGSSVRAVGDDVVLAGSFDGSIDLGQGKMRSAGLTDLFVARITP